MSDDMFYCSFVSIHYIICECGETFPTEDELKVHLERDHSLKKEKKEYKCGVCEAIFSSEQACIEHYGANHIEVKQEHQYIEEEHDYIEEHDYVTTEQTEEVGGEQGEIIFEHVIENPPPVTEPELTIRPKKEKKSKVTYNAKNIVCEVCGKRYASNAALKYHQRVHTGERPYKCTECSKSFTMPLFLQIHTRTHTGERPYECGLCPKAFSNKAALLRHDRVHTGVKPYECPECGKFFTQSNSMKLHVNTVHLKLPAPYKSKTRRNKAKERALLREAILRVIDSEDNTAGEIHQGIKNYECSICSKRFRTRTQIKHHQLTHTDVKDYYCVECDVRFKSAHSLRQHLLKSMKHRDKQSLKFTCTRCTARFPCSRALTEHVRVQHEGVRAHVCGECGAALATRSSLNKHTHAVHRGVRPARRHVCDTCGKAFRGKSVLTNHVRTHTGEKPFECGECGRRFTQRTAMRTHVKLVHLKLRRTSKIKPEVSPPALEALKASPGGQHAEPWRAPCDVYFRVTAGF